MEIKLSEEVVNKIKEAMEEEGDIKEFIEKAVLFYIEESGEKEEFGSSKSRLRSLVDNKDE